MIRELFGLAAFMHAFAQSVRGVRSINVCSVFAFLFPLLLYILKYTYLIFLFVPPILLFITHEI
jgi:hypothetical protein